MLRTRNMESEVCVCILYSVSSRRPRTMSAVSCHRFFVSIFHIFMLHFLQEGGGERGVSCAQGPQAPSIVSHAIDTSARARVTLLRARSRRAAGTAPELMIALRGLGSRLRGDMVQ